VQTKSSLTLFSDKLFPNSSREYHSTDPQITSLVEQARHDLQEQAGEAYGLLTQQARKNLPVKFSRFLARLFLLDPDPIYLQKAARFWVDAQQEMLFRLQADRTEIETCFCNNGSCGRLMEVGLDLSDRHDQGRSVAVLTFDSGLKLVYKPRDIGIEDWYFRTLTWLNDIGTPLPFQSLRVLRQPAYGWMQFISHQRCRSKRELCQYYRNAGALLCLLDVLRAEDCHFQNLIASVEYPVLVDAETLFQPRLSDSEVASIARTGMIPHWKFGPRGQAYDVSALGFVASRSTHFRIPIWDATGIRYDFGELMPEDNVPFPPQDSATPESHVEEMASGFGETYRFLANHRRQLMAQIHNAACLQVRYILRETVEYYDSLNDGLRSTDMIGIRLGPLPPSRVVFDPLRQHEVNALEELDIPRFTFAANSTDLCEVEHCFPLCGLELVADRIERLSEHDLEEQLTHLHLSWSLLRVSRSLS
jgi:type 2 lantibiotic biosynthesis protein LanM